jgi:hypothetical protein
MTTGPLNPGDTVRWWDKDGGWRFGRLATAGHKHARIDMGGTVKRVPISELRQWPPTYAQDTTPPRRVKRGRN